MTPLKPTASPSARTGVGRSAWSNRIASTAPISGTDAIMIAANDEATRCSPKAISGNGIEISAIAYIATQRQ
jgi:hypothetical protein